MTTESSAVAQPLSDVELAITGMTCASCANRNERKLNKLDGVSATVNYATEKAKVSFPVTVSTDDLLRTVEAAGYAAALPTPPDEVAAAEPERDPLLQRLLVSTALSIPVVAMAMGSGRAGPPRPWPSRMPSTAAKVIWQMPRSDEAAPARAGNGMRAEAMVGGMVRPTPIP